MKWKSLPADVKAGIVKSPYSKWLIEDVRDIETPGGTMYFVEVDNEYTLSEFIDSRDGYVYLTPSGDIVEEKGLK